MDLWKHMSSSKCSFTCICGIFWPLNPSTTTVYAWSAFYPSLHFTLSLQSAFYKQSAFYPWSAVCSPQSEVFVLHWPDFLYPSNASVNLRWMAHSRGWGLLGCQMPQGGDGKRGQMPCPPSTLQHFSLTAQSNNAVLSILMCDFSFQLTSSLVIELGF